jgi:bifunctional enzyme CysN/CysC
MPKQDDKTVIWITGHSSAGKTTVAQRLQHLLKEQSANCIFLDGDDLRTILSEKFGYSRSERLELAKSYIQLASHLSSQGFVVVISAVAMFDEIFAWFKQNVAKPMLVYLDVPLEERLERDALGKHVYAKIDDNRVQYDIPTDPDLNVANFGETDPDMAAARILEAWQKLDDVTTDRGRSTHWKSFYQSNEAPLHPSPFAEWASKQWSDGDRVIEVGCGNGRDAFYFQSRGHDVIGVDVSSAAVEACIDRGLHENLQFFSSDLPQFQAERDELKADIVYSRFSLHAMTDEEETSTIAAAFALLDRGGYFFIETRSINDPMAKKGDIISHAERIEGHYRRFGNVETLSEKLRQAGFELDFTTEEKGLAVYKDEDPLVIRIIARATG